MEKEKLTTTKRSVEMKKYSPIFFINSVLSFLINIFLDITIKLNFTESLIIVFSSWILLNQLMEMLG